jgi:hypothetical protein
MDRARGFGPRGWGFDSLQARREFMNIREALERKLIIDGTPREHRPTQLPQYFLIEKANHKKMRLSEMTFNAREVEKILRTLEKYNQGIFQE